jgi:hypothetical protein
MAWKIYLILLLGIHKEEKIMAPNNHQTKKRRRKETLEHIPSKWYIFNFKWIDLVSLLNA